MSGAAKSADKGGGGGGGRPAAERVQAKLKVGDVNDPMEAEAEQVAQAVMSGQPAAGVQRMAAPEKKENVNRAEKKEQVTKAEKKEQVSKAEKKEQVSKAEKKDDKVSRAEKKEQVSKAEKKDEGKVSRQADSGGGSSSADAMSSTAQHAVDTKGAGSPMSPSVRGPIESSLGADLSHVRVHDDAAARHSADAINARAFTHGSDIWMGSGESSSDLGLMAHEATHVVQQAGGAPRSVRRLVQRDPVPAPPATGAATGVTPEAALQDLKTFRLPPVKERHRPVYEAWAAAGTLKRIQGYERGEPDQKDSVWLPNVTVAPAKMEALDLTPNFTGRKTISIRGAEIEGTYAQLRDRLKVPNWGRTGGLLKHSLEVDHIVELQVGSWAGGDSGAANEIQNMELLDKSSNASAGSQTKNSVKANVERYLRDTGQTSTPAAATAYLANNDVQFDRVVIGEGSGASASHWWTKAEIEAGEHLNDAVPLQNSGEAGTATSFALISAGGTVLGQYAHDEGVTAIPVASDIDKRRVAGLVISNINLQANYRDAARDAQMGTVTATLELPPQLSALDTPLTLPLHSGGQYSGYIGALPAIGESHFAPLSLIQFDPPGIEGGALTVHGRLTPSIPLLGTTPIDVAIRGTELEFFYAFSAGALALPLPGVAIDDVTLIVAFGTEGFRVEGNVYFSVARLGNGVLTASVGSSGGFEASGTFNFDSELFDQAQIEVWYRERAFGGRGTLAITQPDKVRGIRSLNAEVTFGENSVAATGTVAPDIPGVDSASLSIQYSEADGLVIGGTAALSNLPGIASGTLEAEVRRPPDGGPWAVSAHGTAVPAIPGIATTLDIAYDNGALTILGSADYSRGMLSGHVELGATNRVVGADGVPTDEIGTEIVAYGGGSLTVRITPWLQGTVGVRFLPNGELELMGRIELPDALDIFPEKRFDRNIFSINLDIPIIGFAVAGQRVGIFATIGGGLDLSAGIGPGQLRDLGIGITYNPDHEDQTHISGSAKLVIPADAGLRLFIRGALGAGIPIVSASLGLEVGGQLGLEGAVEAGVNVDWTPATGLVIDALGEIYVQPKFRFDLTGFLTVDADLLLTTINLYEKRWELAAFEAGPDLRFGVRFPIHYEEGQPFDISLDDVQFDVPDIDTMGLIGDLIERIV